MKHAAPADQTPAPASSPETTARRRFSAPKIIGIVAGSIVCTMLGIVFPMTKHNPLTAIVGLGSFALAGTLLLFAIGLLDLCGPILAVVLVAILAAMILYSILGIQTHQRSMRYEHR